MEINQRHVHSYVMFNVIWFHNKLFPDNPYSMLISMSMNIHSGPTQTGNAIATPYTDRGPTWSIVVSALFHAPIHRDTSSVLFWHPRPNGSGPALQTLRPGWPSPRPTDRSGLCHDSSRRVGAGCSCRGAFGRLSCSCPDSACRASGDRWAARFQPGDEGTTRELHFH